ncbi:MAG: S8 family peptidase [Bacteroidales bacterium]|nr:S8 family peptidase [Bacteroidales bacterium]
MKKLLAAWLVLTAVVAGAQTRNSVETRALMQQLRSGKQGEQPSQRFLSRFPIETIKGEETIGVVAKVDETFDAEALETAGIKVTSRIADIVSMRVPLQKLALLEDWPGITHYSVSHKVAPTMDQTRVDTRTDSVQAGMGVPMPFDGEGVLIGITDWGFDYRHPNLNVRDNLRIYKAWDHFKLSGPSPAGFDYGTVYDNYEEVYAAGGDTSGLYGYGTHGTHVAGIASGNGIDGRYIGQAPGAHLLLGSWLLGEAAWLDQVAWMYRESRAAHKRLVINSSWGMYTFSNLDGTSLLSQAINHYADSGVVFVTSAGNNGSVGFHLRHTFRENDTCLTHAEWYADGIGEALIFWGEPEKQFAVSFALSRHDTLHEGPWFATADNIDYLESYLVVGSDTIHYDIMTESANFNDNRPHALLNVEKKDGYQLIMRCVAAEGTTVDAWNVCNVDNHAGNVGMAFVNDGKRSFLSGDTNYGVGEPGCAAKTITVAAHRADRRSATGTIRPYPIASFSSHGPAFGDGVKPEISAPGYEVVSSVSSYYNASYSNSASTRIDGRAYNWTTFSGTSMSSPAVTGIVALMLQANPHLTVDEVREILFTTARNDNITGALLANDSVSPVWGHGKADALRAVNAAYDALDIEEAARVERPLSLFPNPTHDVFTLLTFSNTEALLEVFSLDGKRVWQQTTEAVCTLDVSSWPKGVYMVRITDRSGARNAKLVVQ